MSQPSILRETQTHPGQPEVPAPKWGELPGEERQRELAGALRAWEQLGLDEQAKRLSVHQGPFAWRPLSGADAFYLAIVALASLPPELGGVGGDQTAALRRLRGSLASRQIEFLSLASLHLEFADLTGAHLDEASLTGAHLEGTNLRYAHLEGANLRGARLEGANLRGAHLDEASLTGAHLEGADLPGAHLERADLSGVWLDSATMLTDVTLDTQTRLGDVHWGGVGTVDLTRLPWGRIPTLGDERGVGPRASVAAHEAVVRAYRQLAAQLRAQGMNEVADRFLLRAQMRQRQALLRQMLQAVRRPWRMPAAVGRYLFSWVLAALAGYGYRPGRTLVWYVATIAAFAFAFSQVTHGTALFGLMTPVCGNPQTVGCIKPLKWYEALVLSIASLHGRGFFFLASPGDPVVILAAAEAVIGLFIEISFIATFSQRFFGPR